MVTRASEGDSKKRRVRKLAKGNPKVDVDQVDGSITLMESLRHLGMTGPRYDLANPHENRLPRREAANHGV